MKKLLYVLIAAMVVAACSSMDAAGPQPVGTATEDARDAPQSYEPALVRGIDGTTRNVQSGDKLSVDFFDIGSFDRALSSGLRGDPEIITVRFQAPVTVNDVPERLNTWLTWVEKYEGAVKIQEDPGYQTRGFIVGGFSLVIGAVTGVYQAIRTKLLYGPVKDYNATVFFTKESGTITKVVFTRKEPQQ